MKNVLLYKIINCMTNKYTHTHRERCMQRHTHTALAEANFYDASDENECVCVCECGRENFALKCKHITPIWWCGGWWMVKEWRKTTRDVETGDDLYWFVDCCLFCLRKLRSKKTCSHAFVAHTKYTYTHAHTLAQRMKCVLHRWNLAFSLCVSSFAAQRFLSLL